MKPRQFADKAIIIVIGKVLKNYVGRAIKIEEYQSMIDTMCKELKHSHYLNDELEEVFRFVSDPLRR